VLSTLAGALPPLLTETLAQAERASSAALMASGHSGIFARMRMIFDCPAGQQ